MRSAWKRLNLSHSSVSIPPLIVKYDIGNSDYTVWVTDLTLIWKESLDRKRIIRRSFDVDTSIDPSEDSDQFRLFLQGVQKALEQEPGTTLDLVRNDDGQNLLLQTLTPLPGSLRPLEWSIALLPASQSTLTNEFVIPMLSQQVVANAEKASLLRQLKEKDQVITKLADRMQLDGVDMGRMFPGVLSNSSKTMSRQAIGKLVKGFGEFDEHQWQKQMINDVAPSKGVVELISGTFGTNLDWPETVEMPEYKNWWKLLRHEDSQPVGTCAGSPHTGAKDSLKQDEYQSTPKRVSTATLPQVGIETNTEVEDLEVRVLERPQYRSDSTTDESDHDRQSVRPESTLPKDKSSGYDRASDTARKSSPAYPKMTEDDKTEHQKYPKTMSEPEASIPDNHTSGSDVESTQTKSVIANQAPALKQRAKLGKIGGKAKVENHDESHSHMGQVSPAIAKRPAPSLASPPSEPGASSGNQANLGRKDRTSVQPRSSSPPRETSQERANRNREKLKRELESKSHTGTKKKRKF